MNKKVIGKNIMNLRKNAHITQSELAEKLNVSDKTVSRWERGECLPSISLLRDMSRLFSITIEEIEKEEDIANDNSCIIKDKKRKILVISIILILVLFSLFFLLIFYVKNNYNQFQIYQIVSRDKNSNIEGRLILTPKQDILTIFSVKISNEDLLNEKIVAFYYGIEIDEKIVHEVGINVDNYEYDSMDKVYLFQDMLKDIKFDLKSNDIRKIIYGNPRIVIKWVTETLEKGELTIYLSVIKEFSSDKIFYKQKNEDNRIDARDRAYSLADGKYYQLGNISVDKISNIDNLYLNVGDKVDIYVYSDEIDEELSKTPWLSNVLIFMITDGDNNAYTNLNSNIKELHLLEPVESGKVIHVKTVTELPGYKIEIKVNNTISNDEIMVDENLDRIILNHFIVIPESY